jgi:uncharacterized protein
MNGLVRHLSVLALGASMAGTAIAARQTDDVSGSATFIVLVGGTRVGTETVTLTRRGAGWQLSSAGIIKAPFDLVSDKFEVLYGPEWQPETLTLVGSLRGQALQISSTFAATTATTELLQGAQHASATQPISPRPVVLAGSIYAAFEALAVRMSSAKAGDSLPVYVAPTGEVTANVVDITPKRISIGARTIELRAIRLTLSGSAGIEPIELWIDARGRMARLESPAASVVVIRDDLATVMARDDSARNVGDEDTFIGANGFSLSATVTRPASAKVPAPAVVLVAGPGAQDRDYNVFGVSVFTDLAGTLAAAGNLVVRYDARGIGRSGGRTETSRLTEYSEDVLGITSWLRKRKDVDGKRIVLAGFGDAAAVTLTAASRDKAVAGVILLGASSRSGRETTLEQQRRVLAPLPMSDAEKAARVVFQTRIMDAVVSGKGWETLPVEVRQQADTPWFKSWLEFNPATVLKNVKQPLLIVHGGLDAEVPSSEADRLATLSEARPKMPSSATSKVVVPGANHLLVPARTGTVDEYPTLTTRSLAASVGSTIAEWIRALR